MLLVMENIVGLRIYVSLTTLLMILSSTKGISSKISSAQNGKSVNKDTLYYHGNSSLVRTNVEENADGISMMNNLMFADGMVSVDCLRCLCLKQSNCKPVGCNMQYSQLSCGYFQITSDIWIDCGKLGSDWKKCANEVMCSSLCIQNYMKRYAELYNCPLKCEGFSRELLGGPNGCNIPFTVAYWNAVQKVPGCKGVE